MKAEKGQKSRRVTTTTPVGGERERDIAEAAPAPLIFFRHSSLFCAAPPVENPSKPLSPLAAVAVSRTPTGEQTYAYATHERSTQQNANEVQKTITKMSETLQQKKTSFFLALFRTASQYVHLIAHEASFVLRVASATWMGLMRILWRRKGRSPHP